MRLIQNYFSGPQANRRVLLFENFVSMLGGQQDDLSDMYRNKIDRDYMGDDSAYRGINVRGMNDLGMSDRGGLDNIGSLGGIGGLGGGIGGITSILGGADPLNRSTFDRRTVG